jgi:CBS domain-containing protein
MSYIGKKIKDVMVPRERLIIAPPEFTVEEAARLMWDNGVGSILIVKEGKLLGIFTERDLVRVVATKRSTWEKLENVMTKNPLTLKPNEPLSKAAILMSEKGFRHIPVVDEKNELVGIISARDVARHYAEFSESLE